MKILRKSYQKILSKSYQSPMPEALDKQVAMWYIIYDVPPFQLDLYSKKHATKNSRGIQQEPCQTNQLPQAALT